MKKPNIDFLLNMTKECIDGKMDWISYELDFPYEIELRYKKMVKENQMIAEMIYDCLVENGIYACDHLGKKEAKEKIKREYMYIREFYLGE